MGVDFGFLKELKFTTESDPIWRSELGVGMCRTSCLRDVYSDTVIKEHICEVKRPNVRIRQNVFRDRSF